MVDSRRGRKEDEENPVRINRWEQNRRTYAQRVKTGGAGIQVAGLEHRRKTRGEQKQNKMDGLMDGLTDGRMNDVPLHFHSTVPLTVGEVGDFLRQRRIAEVFIWHVHVHVLLGFGCFQEGHEACCEGRHEDGQHAKVQHVPQVHDVLSGPVAPDLLTLRPDHTCGTSSLPQPEHHSLNTCDILFRLANMVVLRVNKYIQRETTCVCVGARARVLKGER